LKKIIVLTLASLSLMTGLAGAAQATPGRTTNAPPPVPARVRNAEQSALTSKLATLHLKRGLRPSARELKALGLKPVPKPLAARLKQLTKSNRARAATVGSTYWFTYQYYGHFWADVYYDGPYFNSGGNMYYLVYSNYKICDSAGGACTDLNVYTYVENVNIYGTWYFHGPTPQPDSAGLPVYGTRPFQDPSVAY
jgi:hypothetical protein